MIENAFNYVGSKDRIFPLIDANLDKTKNNFVDVFCGSGVVGVNEVYNYKNIMLNDACWQMTELLKYLRDNEFSKII
jgi:site-specific DNA-adenine methylase